MYSGVAGSTLYGEPATRSIGGTSRWSARAMTLFAVPRPPEMTTPPMSRLTAERSSAVLIESWPTIIESGNVRPPPASANASSSPATTRVGAFAASSSAAAAAARSSIDISPASSGSIVTERESGGRCDVTGAAGAAWCERPPKGDGINAVPALHASASASRPTLLLPISRRSSCRDGCPASKSPNYVLVWSGELCFNGKDVSVTDLPRQKTRTAFA